MAETLERLFPDDDEAATPPPKLSRHLTASSAGVVVEALPFRFNKVDYCSHLAYKKGATSRPLVVVFPNYAGEKQFDIDQATFLAACGYTALSVDMYRETGYPNGVDYPRSIRGLEMGAERLVAPAPRRTRTCTRMRPM